MAGGCRLRAVVVTDVVGSTRLRTTHGDPRADELLASHHEILGDVVTHFEGTRSYSVGDGIVAVFPSATAGLEAAVAMQQAIDHHNRLSGAEPIDIRVGLAAGEVCEDGDQLRGRALDVADLLCQAAGPGGVLVDRLCLDLAGSYPLVEAVDATVAVEGAPAQVAALRWTPELPLSQLLGLPVGWRGSETLPFFGRAIELERLHGHWRTARRGRLVAVALHGEAGIGKSRLVRQFCSSVLQDEGAVVLLGRCREDLAAPFTPFVEALTEFVSRVPRPRRWLGPHAGELRRLLPDLAAHVPGLDDPIASDAEAEQALLFDAVAGWLTEVAAEASLVVVVEDLHWAGDSTAKLMERLFVRLRSQPVTMLLTFRDEDPAATGARSPAWTDVLGADVVEDLPVRAFHSPVVRAMLAERLGPDWSAQHASWFQAASGGNPLMMAELLSAASVTSGGAAVDVNDASPAGGGALRLPERIRSSIMRRLSQISPRARQAVEAGAILGREFSLDLIRAMVPAETALASLAEAVDAGLLREVASADVRYRFAHALTRVAVYDSLSRTRRAELHEQAGHALERTLGSSGIAELADLTRHFSEAVGRGLQPKASHYAGLAADAALLAHADSEAATLFQQALELDAGRPRQADAAHRIDLLIGLGEAQRRLGDPDFLAVLYEAADRAESAGDGVRMARAMLATWQGTFSRAGRVDASQVERMRRALALLGDADTALAVELQATLGVELAWAPDRSVAADMTGAALERAERLGDPALVGLAMARRQWTVFHPLAERRRATERLVALAGATPDPHLRFEAHTSAVLTAVYEGRTDEALRHLDEARRLCDVIDQPHTRRMLLIPLFCMHLLLGRLREADATVSEVRELAGRTGMPVAQEMELVMRFWLDFDRAQPDDLDAALSFYADQFERFDPVARPAIVHLAAELGRGEVITKTLTHYADLRPEDLPRDQVWLWNLCNLAAGAAAVADLDLAERLLPSLRAHAGQHGATVFSSVGSVARYVGLIEAATGRREAEASLATAVAANDAARARSWAARTRLDLADLLRGAGRGAEAEALVAAAAGIVAEVGLPVVGERVQRWEEPAPPAGEVFAGRPSLRTAAPARPEPVRRIP